MMCQTKKDMIMKRLKNPIEKSTMNTYREYPESIHTSSVEPAKNVFSNSKAAEVPKLYQ